MQKTAITERLDTEALSSEIFEFYGVDAPEMIVPTSVSEGAECGGLWP